MTEGPSDMCSYTEKEDLQHQIKSVVEYSGEIIVSP